LKPVVYQPTPGPHDGRQAAFGLRAACHPNPAANHPLAAAGLRAAADGLSSADLLPRASFPSSPAPGSGGRSAIISWFRRFARPDRTRHVAVIRCNSFRARVQHRQEPPRSFFHRFFSPFVACIHAPQSSMEPTVCRSEKISIRSVF
jgi:hypothetical protein